MPIDRGNVRALVRAIAYDCRGSRLGRVAQVFIDDRTDEPAWVAVDVTRTRGMRLLPLAGAGLRGRHLVIRAQRSTVRSAPRIDLSDGQLSSQDECRLLEHYGMASAGPGTGPQTADFRPASPWPDDTQRETAWERPAQSSRSSQDTQAMPLGWEQPAAKEQTARIPMAEKPGGIGDRGASPPTEPIASAGPASEHRPTPPSPGPYSQGSAVASPTR
ncbi:MAG: hypothetical protein M3313_12040 [Actinomycetota bacterium]|nr:hypothetical protein [Actinomycetota bacterium]